MNKENFSIPGKVGVRQQFTEQIVQYVHANDLRALLKLALALHDVGEPQVLLQSAFDGLVQLAAADAWAAVVFPHNLAGTLTKATVVWGGTDLESAKAMAAQIETEYRSSRTSIGEIMATKHVRGRVLSVLDDEKTIHSVLRLEPADKVRPRRSWMSIIRSRTGSAFLERERRLLELFHSQSAWLLFSLAEC